MKIKRLLGGLVSTGLFAALAVPAGLAKPQAAPPQNAGKETAMRGRLQSVVESLNLTDDQRRKLKDIFADSKTKRQAVLDDNSLSDDQKKAKMKELHEDTLAKVNGLLTPDQQIELKSKVEAGRPKPPAQP